MKSSNKKSTKAKPSIVISDKVRSYANDPFVIRKAQKSKEFLEKNGFPKEFLDKR